MPKVKSQDKTKRVVVEDLKSSKVTDEEQEKLRGGKTPSPGGPIPIPYPNTSK